MDTLKVLDGFKNKQLKYVYSERVFIALYIEIKQKS